MRVIDRVRGAVDGWRKGLGNLPFGEERHWRGTGATLLLPGSNQDWAAKAGDAWKSSTAAIGINWIATSFPEAPLAVRSTASGNDVFDTDHPLPALIRRPNPYYSGRELWHATITSMLGDGNAYWLIVPDRREMPAELWYIPHIAIEPKAAAGTNRLVDHYEWRVPRKSGGRDVVQLPPEMVCHFRYGMDPERLNRGLGPLRCVARDMAADNEMSTYTAVLVANMGIPGLMVSSADPEAQFLEGEPERIMELLTERTSGDKRGRPMFVPAAIKVDHLAFSPESLALDKLYTMPTARICAAMALSPSVLGLPDDTNTYANKREAKTQAWENGVLPIMAMLAETLDHVLLPRYKPPSGMRCAFDTRNVKALQDDQDALARRAALLYRAGVWTRAEARVVTGLPWAAVDVIYATDLVTPPPANPTTGDTSKQRALPIYLRTALSDDVERTPWSARVDGELARLNGANG